MECWVETCLCAGCGENLLCHVARLSECSLDFVYRSGVISEEKCGKIMK